MRRTELSKRALSAEAQRLPASWDRTGPVKAAPGNGTQKEGTVPARLTSGMALLTQAQAYSEDMECDPWDFAVEVSSLREAGLTNSDLRWLICKKYVKHAVEISGIVGGSSDRRGT